MTDSPKRLTYASDVPISRPVYHDDLETEALTTVDMHGFVFSQERGICLRRPKGEDEWRAQWGIGRRDT